DPAGDVGADVVAQDHVVVAAADVHAVAVVAGDDVAQVGGRPADDVAVAAIDEDALGPVVAGVAGAGLIRAYQGVLANVAVCPAPQVDANALVVGDQVAVFLVRSADGVARGVLEADAGAVALGVGQGVGAEEAAADLHPGDGQPAGAGGDVDGGAAEAV